MAQQGGGGEAPPGGLSKNELKKRAKAAEKAAKKQAAKEAKNNSNSNSNNNNNNTQNNKTQNQSATVTTTENAATSPPVSKLTLRLEKTQTVETLPALLKVAMAVHKYQIDLQLAYTSDNDTVVTPSLQYNETTVAGQLDAGNAMACAIARMGNVHSVNDNLVIDEWCEWERTQLYNLATLSAKQQTLTLHHLEHALSKHPHLIGHALSVADICIAVTLTNLVANQTLTDQVLTTHPAIASFYTSMQTNIQAAKEFWESLPVVSSNTTTDIDYSEVRLVKVIHSVFANVVRSILTEAGVSNEDVTKLLSSRIVSKCPNEKHGDFQCMAAMAAFGTLKKSGGNNPYQSPQQVAAKIVESLGEDHPVVMGLSMQGAGFVVCRIRPSFLETHVNQMIAVGKLPTQTPEKILECVVDFSSPNIAKEMHVGHLRSTIIGESVCRILESVGHKVHRVNHVGDWGTQFGMLIQYLKEEFPDVCKTDNAELPNITDLTEFYKSAKKRFDESPEFKDLSRTNVVQLQAGDKEYLQMWKMLCDVSRREFERVYKRLDVTVEECGESFYNDKIAPVIEEFKQAGLLQEEEGGAKVVFMDQFQIPLMLQKSDGGYGYDSTDMAALKYRLHTLKADRVIIITDFSQEDHFKMVFQAGRNIGWLDGADNQVYHIGFGTVMGEDGKRFKTRSGDTVRLVDLLDEAVSRMETTLKDRIKEGKANITEDEVHTVAEAIGYGAVKYYDLRRSPRSNYQFSYDEMLDTKGDTAVYLLYARVRLESIMAKAKAEFNVDVQDLVKSSEKVTLDHESERKLSLTLLNFADVMEQALEDLYPKHICEYVYKLANAAADFVTQCKVLGSPEMKSRLLLCYATTVAIHECFDLLGIRHVKRI